MIRGPPLFSERWGAGRSRPRSVDHRSHISLRSLAVRRRCRASSSVATLGGPSTLLKGSGSGSRVDDHLVHHFPVADQLICSCGFLTEPLLEFHAPAHRSTSRYPHLKHQPHPQTRSPADCRFWVRGHVPVRMEKGYNRRCARPVPQSVVMWAMFVHSCGNPIARGVAYVAEKF